MIFLFERTTMIRFLTILIFAASTLVATNLHAARVVQVVDPQGAPIADAMVEPITASTNGNPLRTDKNGNATLPRFSVQEIQWVSVSKAGYETSGHLTLPKTWPWKITLKPTSSKPPPVPPKRLQLTTDH
jgi:hypothetical protein